MSGCTRKKPAFDHVTLTDVTIIQEVEKSQLKENRYPFQGTFN